MGEEGRGAGEIWVVWAAEGVSEKMRAVWAGRALWAWGKRQIEGLAASGGSQCWSDCRGVQTRP